MGTETIELIHIYKHKITSKVKHIIEENVKKCYIFLRAYACFLFEDIIMNKMDDELFNQIIDTSTDALFWKDADRRFVGVNKAFLDFYGFESEDVLIGKNDEDMEWHSNPVPYMQDELRVLSGETTYKVPGKCLVRGLEMDIIASKKPLYKNGEIVGLVGGFSDVTDLMRRKIDKKDSQIMYTVDQLRKYPYFDKLLDETRIEEILDSLTGIISRGYIIDFAKSLIAHNVPFTFTIVDLDNFKYFNDNCGHHAGDLVLMYVARSLAEYSYDLGVVGRFGGDELLIINLRDLTTEDKTSFFKGIYESGDVLRRNMVLDGQQLFITGTSGCASFPENADNYNDLFEKTDKTLYRGKTKGRNCYVIYDESKHADIEIKNLARKGIYSSMKLFAESTKGKEGTFDKLSAVALLLMGEYHISEVYYIDDKNELIILPDGNRLGKLACPSDIIKDELTIINGIDSFKSREPVFHEILERKQTGCMIAVKLGEKGYLICCVKNKQRLWQQDECAILYFISTML